MSGAPGIGRLAVATRAMAAIPRLAAFLDAAGVEAFGKRLPERCDAVAGWGLSAQALRARALAQAAGLPFWHVEDGFFRSVGLGKDGAIPLSLVRDAQRPCYDASGPSDFEALMRVADAGRGEAIRALIVSRRLSKYNCEPDRAPDLGADARPRILLVDQVAGDRSIAGALADPSAFAAMARAAREERPGARLLLRVHPDVVAGRARGVLAPLARALSLEVLADRVGPHALLDVVDEVWTVSSQLGCEALLRGLPVVTFGAPFYAGWGLSDDRALARHPEVAARRGPVAGAAALAAALAGYSRFVDPIHGDALSAEEGLLRLARLRDRYAERAGRHVCVNVRRWKRPGVRAFLEGPFSQVSFSGAGRARLAEPARIVSWGYGVAPADIAALERRHGPIWRMEDGFLRSPGLGSDFVPSASAVIAPGPLYFDATAPNSFEHLANSTEFGPGLLIRAAALRRQIVVAGLSKYNLAAAAPRTIGDGRPFHLVVGQVETDASIRLGAGDVRTNGALLRAARAAAPDGFIVYKEHPDVAARNRSGRLGKGERALADLIVEEGDAVALIGGCARLHTMTSLAGFEALLRGKPVRTYGSPFYAGWGLTQDIACPPRGRSLSLDELTAAALILYPRYVDPATRLPCEAEDVVRLLREGRRFVEVRRGGLLRQLRRSLGWLAAQARA